MKANQARKTGICVVVWMDREQSKLFHFSEEKMERSYVHPHQHLHHTHALDQFDKRAQERKLYIEIIQHLSDASRLLIIGPGVAKYHFQNYLTEHFPALAKRIVACETTDHPTDGQIAALAKRLFSAIPESA
jgi:stalled ribosome rescue protein Dom34